MAVQRRNTRQRKLVLDAVRQSYNHPTADEIYNVVRAQDDKISRGTVYRNLNLLADAGEILSIKTPGGTASIARSSRMRISSAPRAAASSTYRSPSMPSSTPRRPSKSAGTSRRTTPSSRVSAPTAGRCSGHALKSTFPRFAAKNRFLGMSQMSTQQVDDAALLRPCARSGRGR